jgi:hypothetical protein
MRNCRLDLLLVVFLVLLSLPLCAGEYFGKEKLGLTVEQTLALAYILPVDWWNAYHGANPEALPALRRLIVTDNTDINFQSAVFILGVIGTEKDLSFIKDVLEDPDPKRIPHVWMPLGFMARRGIEEAKQLLTKGMTTDFWDDLGLEMPVGRPAHIRYDNLLNVYRGYVISGMPDLAKRKEHILKTIEDRATRERVDSLLDLEDQTYIKKVMAGHPTTSGRESNSRPSDKTILQALDHLYVEYVAAKISQRGDDVDVLIANEGGRNSSRKDSRAEPASRYGTFLILFFLILLGGSVAWLIRSRGKDGQRA